MIDTDDSERLCEHCGATLVACEKCECLPPDNYIRPGLEAFMYVNAYEVTRHYGGPEDGDWWYNHEQPLASIPLRAISHEYHDDLCYTCNQAKIGGKDMQGALIKPCKWGFHLVSKQDEVDFFTSYLKDIYKDIKRGDIYSVLGGAELMVILQDHPAEESSRPNYE